MIQCPDGGGAKGGAIDGSYQNGGCDESLKMRLAYSHPGGQHKYKVDLFPLTLGTEINPRSRKSKFKRSQFARKSKFRHRFGNSVRRRDILHLTHFNSQ